MEFIFQSLTDLALRRVYKFVLKQTIGRFLKDELLMDQLEVQSREGVVRIRDLQLDPDRINGELRGLPVRVAAASVNLVEVHLSYSSLLTESCRFTADTIDIVLRAGSEKCDSPGPEKDEGTVAPSESSSSSSSSSFSFSEEAQEGLGFIAQWIEIVVAKLRVQLRKINVRWQASGGGVCLSLADLDFYNGDPALFAAQTSIEISQLASSRSDLATSLINSSKILRIGSIAASVWGDTEERIVLEIQRSTVKVHVDSAFEGLDVECTLGSTQSNLDFVALQLLTQVVSDVLLAGSQRAAEEDIFPSPPPQSLSANDALLCAYEELLKAHSLRINQPSTNHSVVLSAFADCETVVESDGDFDSDNEDMLSDSDYDIPNEPQQTQLLQSTLQLGSSVYASALFGPEMSSSARNSLFRLRISMPEVSFLLNRDDSVKLSLRSEDCVFIFNTLVDQNGQNSSSKLSLSLRGFEISELDGGEGGRGKQTMLSFFPVQDARDIFSSPDVEISLNSERGETSIGISLQGLMTSFDVRSVALWIDSFKTLKPLQIEGDAPPSLMRLTLALPVAECFLCADPLVPHSLWDDVHSALRLDLVRSVWHPLRCANQQEREKHLATSRGGLRFSFRDISLRSESKTSLTANLETERIEGSIFLKTESDIIYAAFVTASSGATDKVSVRLGALEADQDQDGFAHEQEARYQQPVNDELIGDLGPQPPLLSAAQQIIVNVSRLDVDFQQREYNALIAIADTLVFEAGNRKEQESISPKNENNSFAFGIVIKASTTFFSIGENDFDWWSSSLRGGREREAGKDDCLAELCSLCASAERAAALSERSEKHRICVAIRAPRIDVMCTHRNIFVGMRADDLSIYELQSTQFASLRNERFDFFSPPHFDPQLSNERFRQPIVHRAFFQSEREKSTVDAGKRSHSHLADHSRFGSAFEVRLSLSSVPIQSSLECMKALSFFIDFYDIVINYDPSSQWLMRLVALLSPLSLHQLQIAQLCSLVETIESSQIKESEAAARAVERARERMSVLISLLPVPFSPAATSSLTGREVLPFETTKVSVRVRDSLIAYYCPSTDSSLLLSVDVVSLGSTIVSTSDLFSLKISLSSLAFFFSHHSSQKKIPLNKNWREQGDYKQIVSVDRLSTVVSVRESDRQVTLDFVLGNCCVRGCFDSLDLLACTVQVWLAQFEQACLQSERVLHCHGLVSEGEEVHPQCPDEVDRLRIIDDTQCEDELISEELIRGLEFGEENDADSPSNGAGQYASVLKNLIVEDFYGQSDNDFLKDDEQWIADYGSVDRSVGDVDLERSVLTLSPPSMHADEEDDEDREGEDENDDEEKVDVPKNSFGLSSVFLFSKPSNVAPEDVEMHTIDLPSSLAAEAEAALSEVATAVEPGLTASQIAELENLEKAWADARGESEPEKEHSRAQEQRAFWYDQSDLEVDNLYVTPAATRWEKMDTRPENERKLKTNIVVSLQGDVKIQLFEQEFRGIEECREHASIEICLHDVKVKSFSYEESKEESLRERVEVQIKEFIVVYAAGAQRNKVIGAWRTASKPHDETRDMFFFALLTYCDVENKRELRARASLQPLRVFLSEDVINFVKRCVEVTDRLRSQSSASAADPQHVAIRELDSDFFLQAVEIAETAIKIDFRASHVNIAALQNGDYLQLLNIFPIDGLEIVLKSVNVNGEGSASRVGQRLIETWVHDIYNNQLLNVVAGAVPLKGLIHIGQDVHNLFVPSSTSKTHVEVTRHLKKSTKKLATTIAREALDLTHKLSLFVAKTITELADPSSTVSKNQPQRQPRGLGEGLSHAWESLSREVHSVADVILAVPIRQYERSGATGAMTSVVRALPVAMLRPMVGLAEGFSMTALGFRNQLDPSAQRDEEELWNTQIN